MWWTFRDQLVSQVNLETRQPTDRWVVNPDLARSLAKCSEIARFPNRFERGCEGAGAGCALRPDGKVAVVDTCHKGSPDGPVEMAEGEVAVVAPGKLDVTFVPCCASPRATIGCFRPTPPVRSLSSAIQSAEPVGSLRVTALFRRGNTTKPFRYWIPWVTIPPNCNWLRSKRAA